MLSAAPASWPRDDLLIVAITPEPHVRMNVNFENHENCLQISDTDVHYNHDFIWANICCLQETKTLNVSHRMILLIQR